MPRGRPAKPIGQVCSQPVKTVVTPAELEAIRKAAESAGLSVSAWARHWLVQAAGLPKPPESTKT